MVEDDWEGVLPEALHAVRSLLCTATNNTPHERFCKFQRRSGLGRTLPSWLVGPGPVLLRRFVRNKNEALCDEVELLDANHSFARIRYPDGRESTVSTTDLARSPNGGKDNYPAIDHDQVFRHASMATNFFSVYNIF